MWLTEAVDTFIPPEVIQMWKSCHDIILSSDDTPGLVYLPPLFLTTGIPQRLADAWTSDAIDDGQRGPLTAQISDEDCIQSFKFGNSACIYTDTAH